MLPMRDEYMCGRCAGRGYQPDKGSTPHRAEFVPEPIPVSEEDRMFERSRRATENWMLHNFS